MQDQIVSGIGLGVGITTTATQTEPIMQTISLVITIISGLVVIGYNIYKWYRKATHVNSDGGTKITIDEMTDGLEKISELITKEGDEK